MTTPAALLALLILAIIATAVRLALTVRRDGHGTRVPPHADAPWADAAQNLPSRPY